MVSAESWSRIEVEAIVDDYFHMLMQELAGQSYNKTAHRRELAAKLNDRSDGSIERKHQNISAILRDAGCQYISGYKPLGNYQALLQDVVEDRIQTDSLFDELARISAEQPAIAPLNPRFENVLVKPPEFDPRAAEPQAPYRLKARAGVFRDYLEREARNRSLGEAGETFVLAYERARLYALGKSTLSDRVEQVSKTKGDGLGYDILSFESDGRERFVEVKTTAFGKQTPFYVTRNELALSKEFPGQFRLCRLFEFRKAPRMFELQGAVSANCLLDPVSYLARFG
jgi:hypothetical protein